MTYGTVNADLRAALVDLLTIRGVTAQLTPAYKDPARALEKAEERAALAQRYRTAVWTYVHRLATIAAPEEFLTPAWWPMRQLGARTAPVRREDGEFAGPSTAELGTRQPIPILEAWRRAAVAAVVGAERDALGMDDRLDVGHRLVLARDVADVALAIAILDHRYRHVPGWTPVDGPVHDKRRDYRDAAAIVAAWAGAQAPYEGYAVDRFGWRPAARPAATDQRDPVERALVALRNAAIYLGRETPSARAMARILELTRQVTVHTQRLAGPFDYLPGLVLRGRELVLAEMVKVFEERINGSLGRGDRVVAELTSTANALNSTTEVTDDQRDRLLRAGDVVRTAIGKRLAAGAEGFVYCVEVGRQLDPIPHGGVHRSMPLYGEITDETCPLLLEAAKEMQVVVAPAKPDDALIESRRVLSEAIWLGTLGSGVQARTSGAVRATAEPGVAAVSV
ncbi:hypothetical protein Xcel_2329 [Xylanimonas cellulosilytica DSM 15894]|uniref:Uncharacterized protein n=1 Tax=Xylanimonas cellulosilytica (strain DSM 15894 / JCM 12276 / CECT 5975 / KCTC 9989 / LMG 20990 / NBRC 107835 / XIL07) TaxID=446471 RepID=D1BVM7_XYLCX|nr:hypothetical protein [Xylanimonas cellulosilytica]ACZ31346.1 hypothetical protein Xcel_2329 [Xylanimonas cellulosilytica DSM 15894]